MSTTAPPRRFRLHERYSLSRLAVAGTVIVKPARPWGFGSRFETFVPCCRTRARVDAAMWAGIGAPYTCPRCGWKWEVWPALGDSRIGRLPRGTVHPHIHADRAEWVSCGHGTRPCQRRK